MKRILYTALAAVLLLTALVSGKLGYETMKSGEYTQGAQVFTTQAQTDEPQKLVEFNITRSEKMVLYPLAADNARQESGFAKYELTAKNKGTDAEYIRFYVAVPSALDDKGILHMDVNTGTFENSETKLFTQKKLTKTTTIKGMEYNVYALTYNSQLSKNGDITPKAVYGFYLDEKVNIKGHKIYVDGDYTEFNNDEVVVYSVVHAFIAQANDEGTFEEFVKEIPASVPKFYDEDGKTVVNNN